MMNFEAAYYYVQNNYWGKRKIHKLYKCLINMLYT